MKNVGYNDSEKQKNLMIELKLEEEKMGKRLLSCFTSDFNKMSGQDLKNAIKASEGRTVLFVSHNIAAVKG